MTQDGTARVMAHHAREDIYLVSAETPKPLQHMYTKFRYGYQKVGKTIAKRGRSFEGFGTAIKMYEARRGGRVVRAVRHRPSEMQR